MPVILWRELSVPEQEGCNQHLVVMGLLSEFPNLSPIIEGVIKTLLVTFRRTLYSNVAFQFMDLSVTETHRQIELETISKAPKS